MIGATSTPIREYRGRRVPRPCARCGVERQARKGAVLCVDCKDALSPVDRQVWLL